MSADDSRLDTLVGEALRAIVESGADAAFIGAFAASHRQRVAQILGVAEKPADVAAGVDLVELVERVVTELEERRASRPRKPKFNLEVAGRRTSVSLSTASLQLLQASKVSPRQARSILESLAATCPARPQTSRSTWVETHLQAALEMATTEATTTVGKSAH